MLASPVVPPILRLRPFSAKSWHDASESGSSEQVTEREWRRSPLPLE
jgi:hypothetical protein